MPNATSTASSRRRSRNCSRVPTSRLAPSSSSVATTPMNRPRRIWGTGRPPRSGAQRCMTRTAGPTVAQGVADQFDGVRPGQVGRSRKHDGLHRVQRGQVDRARGGQDAGRPAAARVVPDRHVRCPAGTVQRAGPVSGPRDRSPSVARGRAGPVRSVSVTPRRRPANTSPSAHRSRVASSRSAAQSPTRSRRAGR